MTSIDANKKKHLQNLMNDKGIIAAAAMDQRGSLKKAIAKEAGKDPSEVTYAMMSEFKQAVVEVLTPHASAILLDPEFGLEAAQKRASHAGLLLAYEQTGYDQTGKGRLPNLITTATVKQLVEKGANAIKILLYYSPFEDAAINEIKHAWIERIGVECAYHQVPFFLEFVGYDPSGKSEKELEYAKIKPEVVSKSMEEFSKDRYLVDVLKVEIPVNMAFVKDSLAYQEANNQEHAYTKEEALTLYQKAASSTNKPFIYLSAGVSDAVFRESLAMASEAKVAYNGVLCGRATWKDGIPVYGHSGVGAFREWLADRGVQNIQALNQILDNQATALSL